MSRFIKLSSADTNRIYILNVDHIIAAYPAVNDATGAKTAILPSPQPDDGSWIINVKEPFDQVERMLRGVQGILSCSGNWFDRLRGRCCKFTRIEEAQ